MTFQMQGRYITLRRMISAWLCVPLLLMVLVGCEAQATPIAAVNEPTMEPEADITELPPLRYGIAAHTLSHIEDIDRLRAAGLVEAMPPNPDLTVYDVAVAYGTYEGWQQSPITHQAVLVLNPQLAPLDDSMIRDIVRQALNPQEVVDSTGIPGLLPAAMNSTAAKQLRTTLANLGYPDGFRLTLAMTSLPGAETITQQLADINLDIVATPIDSTEEALNILQDNRAHLLLLRWTANTDRSTWEAQVGAENIIDLFTLPISYVAAEGVTVTFTENGWPVGTR